MGASDDNAGHDYTSDVPNERIMARREWEETSLEPEDVAVGAKADGRRELRLIVDGKSYLIR